jgi:hypothetical protein
MWMGVLAFVIAAPAGAAPRPLLAASAGMGFDVEGDRTLTNGNNLGAHLLNAFGCEGEIMANPVGLVLRMVGVDGSDDYMHTSFDRLDFTVAASFRPFTLRPPRRGYGQVVLRRLAVEGGFMFEHILGTTMTSANLIGIHVGAHVDVPFSAAFEGAGPFLRVVVQRNLLLDNDTVSTSLQSDMIKANAAALQTLIALGVGF